MISFLDEVTGGIEGDGGIEVCHLDREEAFDSVKCRFLEQKVKAFGVEDMVNNWITQSLKDGSFRMRADGCTSD